jgi:chromosome partitioning protein
VGVVIAVTNNKGGVGKSTVAINLSGALAGEVNSVFLIDADPQGSVSDWLKNRNHQSQNSLIHTNLVVSSSVWSAQELLNKVPQESKNYDYIIIDCPPGNDKITKCALAVSDMAIIPVTPSPYDILSVRKTIELIEEGRAKAGIKVKPYLLVSRKIVGTNLGKDVKNALKVFGIEIFETEICQRVALCEAAIVGQTIFEYDKDSLAANEFDNLSKEVIKWARQT